MTATIQEQLTEIRECADQLVRSFREQFGKTSNAARCASAEYYVDDRGDSGYRVNLDEVSPESTELMEYVADGLGEKFDEIFDVRAEW